MKGNGVGGGYRELGQGARFFFFFFFQTALHRCRGSGGTGGGAVAHMPEKRERHDKLDLMTVAKKRDMKVGRAGRTDRN